MFDIGWAELLVIGCVALIVVGPRDLPKLLRSFGQYVNQMRGMAREFQRSMDEAAREADLSQIKELRQAADELRSLKGMKLDDMARPAAAKPYAPPIKPPAPQTAPPAAAEQAVTGPATPPAGGA
jgi:sec-independent protein translocase protein TatB